MRVVVITGGIGSGKSLSLDIIKKYYPQFGTISSDNISREITNSSKFKEFLLTLGATDFKHEIFQDRELRRKIEDFVHWRVMLKIITTLVKYWLTGTILVAIEIPIWFELKMDWLTRGNNVLVVSKMEQRIHRLKKRYNNSDRILPMINAQLPDEEKLFRADYVIENSKGIAELEEQVKKMLTYYRPSFINIFLSYFIFVTVLVFLTGVLLSR